MKNLRSDNEQPESIEKWGWKYHHLGIPTDEIMPGNIFLRYAQPVALLKLKVLLWMIGWLKLKLIALSNIMTDKSLIEWLLDADVSIQYQVYRDLLKADRHDLKERISKEGWGARFLSLQDNNSYPLLPFTMEI